MQTKVVHLLENAVDMSDPMSFLDQDWLFKEPVSVKGLIGKLTSLQGELFRLVFVDGVYDEASAPAKIMKFRKQIDLVSERAKLLPARQEEQQLLQQIIGMLGIRVRFFEQGNFLELFKYVPIPWSAGLEEEDVADFYRSVGVEDGCLLEVDTCSAPLSLVKEYARAGFLEGISQDVGMTIGRQMIATPFLSEEIPVALVKDLFSYAYKNHNLTPLDMPLEALAGALKEGLSVEFLVGIMVVLPIKKGILSREEVLGCCSEFEEKFKEDSVNLFLLLDILGEGTEAQKIKQWKFYENMEVSIESILWIHTIVKKTKENVEDVIKEAKKITSFSLREQYLMATTSITQSDLDIFYKKIKNKCAGICGLRTICNRVPGVTMQQIVPYLEWFEQGNVEYACFYIGDFLKEGIDIEALNKFREIGVREPETIYILLEAKIDIEHIEPFFRSSVLKKFEIEADVIDWFLAGASVEGLELILKYFKTSELETCVEAMNGKEVVVAVGEFMRESDANCQEVVELKERNDLGTINLIVTGAVTEEILEISEKYNLDESIVSALGVEKLEEINGVYQKTKGLAGSISLSALLRGRDFQQALASWKVYNTSLYDGVDFENFWNLRRWGFQTKK